MRACVKLIGMEILKSSLKKNDFFIFAGCLIYFVGSIYGSSTRNHFDLFGFLLGLFFFLTMIAIQELFNYLTSSKVNNYSKFIFNRGDKKSLLVILTIILFGVYFFILYYLLRINKLIGVNLFYIIAISLLVLMNTSRLGKMIYHSLSVIFEGIIVSPLLFLFACGTQDVNPDSGFVLLTMAFFFLYVSCRSSLLFENFGKEGNKERSLLTLIGWENGIRLQNFTLVLAYVFFSWHFYLVGGLVRNIPLLLTALFGIFSMYMMNRMSRGLKPQWQFIKANAFLHFFAVCYLFVLPLF